MTLPVPDTEISYVDAVHAEVYAALESLGRTHREVYESLRRRQAIGTCCNPAECVLTYFVRRTMPLPANSHVLTDTSAIIVDTGDEVIEVFMPHPVAEFRAIYDSQQGVYHDLCDGRCDE